MHTKIGNISTVTAIEKKKKTHTTALSNYITLLILIVLDSII